MPYDTIAYPANFVNEHGQNFPEHLEKRKFSHEEIRENVFDEEAIAKLKIDTTSLQVLMTVGKDESGHGLSSENFNVTVQAADLSAAWLNLLSPPENDSMQINSIWYHGVYDIQVDTNTHNVDCWQILFNKQNGFLEADFRGGRFYRIQ